MTMIGNMIERNPQDRPRIEQVIERLTFLTCRAAIYPATTMLYGHTDDVLDMAWNRTSNLLATGSKDGTAIIWKDWNEGDEETDFVTLHHGKPVQLLEWNVSATNDIRPHEEG